jgi:hypothetical protein
MRPWLALHHWVFVDSLGRWIVDSGRSLVKRTIGSALLAAVRRWQSGTVDRSLSLPRAEPMHRE